MRDNKTTTLLFILILIIMGQASIDIYIPSLPHMASDFAISGTWVKATLVVYLVGFAVSQLFYGPLSDYYGRRKILMLGLSIYSIASLLCLSSHSITSLLLFRALQGIGIGAASVLSRAIMRDVFDGVELMQVASYTAIAWAIVPIIAPVIGGYIQAYIGWRANFLLMAAFGVIMLLSTSKWLTETLPADHRIVPRFKPILSNYKRILSNPNFIRNIACVILLYSVIITFNMIGPFLLQSKLKLSAIGFGWASLLVASGYLFGSYINSKLLNKIVPSIIIRFGFLILLSSAILMTVIGLKGHINLTVVLAPMFFIMFGIGFIYANCIAGCLKPFPDIAGTAGALYGFLVFCGGGIAGSIVSKFSDLTQLPLAVTIFSLSVLALALYYLPKLSCKTQITST